MRTVMSLRVPDRRVTICIRIIIKWFDPVSGIAVFEWNEDKEKGEHYHIPDIFGIHLGDHIYPNTPVPEPYNTIYFGG